MSDSHSGFGESAATDAGGRVLEAGTLAEGLRVVTFAGQAVPEDGLHVSPPCGGELTVWPDGRFVFEAGELAHAPQDDVGVYYSFVVEDIDGGLLAGSLSVHDPALDRADGFQGWAMDDVLAMEASSIAGLGHDAGHMAWSGGDAGLDAWSHAGNGGVSGGSDLLEYMFKASHEG